MNQKVLVAICFLAGGSAVSLAGTEQNWQKHCAKCHGPDGKGDTKMGKKAGVKDMTTAEYQSEFKEDKAVHAIKNGLKDGEKEKMKPNAILSDDEIAGLVAHIRKFKR
jgi:cytochrome c553